MKKLKLLFMKIVMKYFPFLSKKYDMNYILEASGISVGKGTIFYGPETMQIDRSRPYLLSIGNYCKITSGVTILTHDYSRSVLRRVYGDVVGEGRKTCIGDNVFIGMNAIILMGTHIGNNVIIGAGSVVNGDIPDNVVVAGNPAKIIRSLDEHYKYKKARMLVDAKECILAYYNKYGKIPPPNEIGAFWPLFLDRSEDALKSAGINWRLNGDEPSEILESYLKSAPPLFNGYDEFVEFCLSSKEA